MARAGSPGISRSRKNVTSVMPSSAMTVWKSRRGSVPKRFTRAAALRGAHRQRLQGQVVVAERGRVEPVHPVTHAVPVGAVVDHDERGLLVDDLLDLVVHLLPGAAVELAARLGDQGVGLAAGP